jgi:hypothetical protein
MSYLFGDSTPSPFRINFIEFLRLAMGFSVHVLRVEHHVLMEQTRRIQLEDETDVDRHRLEQLIERVSKTVDEATTDVQPRVADYAVVMKARAREVVESGLQALQEALAEDISEIEQSIKLQRKSSLTALEKVLLLYDLPEAKETIRVRLADGGRYTASLESTTPYGLETVLDLAIPSESAFAHDARVDKFVEGLEIRAPETAGWIRKESRMVPQKLGRFHITEATIGEEFAIKLRSSPEAHATGYDIAIRAGDEPQLQIVKIGKDVEGSGAFDADPNDLPTVVRLREKLEEACRALATKRRALTAAKVAGQLIEESTGMRSFVEQLVQVLAPMVREIAAHSLSPGELVLRRMIGDDRREEIFVTKSELAATLEDLSEADRRFFAPLELDPWSAPATVHRSSPVATKAREEDQDPPSGIKRSNRPPPMRSGVGS